MLQVDIREVGPRDGLQAEAPIAISDRVSLINQLISAGVRHIEVASFMRDDVVPSMAGAEEVIAAISERSGITVAGLVANLAQVVVLIEKILFSENHPRLRLGNLGLLGRCQRRG